MLAIVVVGLVQSPMTLYDSVSYHLVFPARWLQEHRLSIVQTPFSDLAQAYQEMGDVDGAREILQEVLHEGDDEQKAEAKTLLSKLA